RPRRAADQEDADDIADAEAAEAEGGEPVPLEEIEADSGPGVDGLDVDATELTDEQPREMLGDDPGAGHEGDWKFWKPAIRGAIRDAIAYWTPHSDDEETADPIWLWRR